MSYGINAPQGLVPVGHINGSSWNGQTQAFVLPAAYNANLFIGTPVMANPDGTGTVILWAAGNPVLGVVAGVRYQLPGDLESQSKAYWPANTVVATGTTAYVDVIIDQSVVYSIQLTGAGLAQTGIFSNALIENIGNGNTSNGNATCSLGAPVAGNAAYPCKVIGIDGVPGNQFGVPYNNALVVINNSVFSAGTAGI